MVVPDEPNDRIVTAMSRTREDAADPGQALIEPPLWLVTISAIKTGLQQAAENHDQAVLDRAAGSFRRMLNREITRVNDSLVTLAGSLQLETIVQAMSTIRDKICETDADAQVVIQVNQGVEDMETLSGRLASLVKTHNIWQAVDDQLRLGEVSIENEPGEFREEIWPQVKSLAIPLYGNQDSPWALALQEQAVRLEESLAGASTRQIGAYFQRYRNSSSQRFRKVDKELLDLCTQLQQIGNSLQIVIRLFDE